jgi:acyl-coenzyme A thioesterase PaaI-like protein
MTIPEGFQQMMRSGVYFNQTVGPFYWTVRDEKVVVGMMTDARHLRGKGFIAGLVTATLADLAMGSAVAHQLWPDIDEKAVNQIKLVTVSLNVDFIASPPVGAWLEAETDVIKTGRVCFAESLIKFSNRTMMRANASFVVRE